jgi:uncharacterized membrane protein (UPF0127 family)
MRKISTVLDVPVLPLAVELRNRSGVAKRPHLPQTHIVQAVNTTRGLVLAERVVWATGAAKRRGLLGRDRLDLNEGIYLVPCQWVHMFGMKFPIDVAFIARSGIVLAVHRKLPPNRLSRLMLRAEGVLELAAGALSERYTVPGDRIEFRDT